MFTESKLIKSLLTPKFFPHDISEFEVKETHLSWVVLTGQYAYKIKKPVDFGFVNFTTTGKRKHFCDLELKLNKRLTSGIYLDVLPIYGSESSPSLSNDGREPFEYAIKMTQFRQDNLFDTLQEKDLIKPKHIESLALQISAFHDITEKVSSENQLGGYKSVYNSTIGNFLAFKDFDIDTKTKELIEELHQWTLQELDSKKDLFEKRKHDKFVRHCHGDIHLGNIALMKDTPIIFDCIDFNDEFYWIDTVNEVAFLAMDLMFRNENEYANQFINSYFAKTNDYSGIQLLRFYLIYRALVRAKVAMFTAPKELYDVFEKYVKLAHKVSKDSAKFLGITYGLSGSGKSTTCKKIAGKHNSIVLRSDIERLHICQGNMEYTDTVTNNVYKNLLSKAEAIIDSGISVIIDATFIYRDKREPFLRLARSKDINYVIINTIASQKTMEQRILDRKNDVSEATTTVLHEQAKLIEPLSSEEQSYCITVDTEAGSIETEIILAPDTTLG